MTRIIYKKTPNVQKVIDLYEQSRVALPSGDMSQSLTYQNPAKRTWLEFFGLAYERGEIFEVKVPNGPISDRCFDILTSDDENNKELKKKYQYYCRIYNICVEYIRSNQKRFFAANLDVLDHPKVLTMTLIAHMCQNGIKTLTQQEHECYQQRIYNFVVRVIDEDFITASSNHTDKDLLTCQTALVGIRSVMETRPEKEGMDDEILKFYENLQHTNEALVQIAESINLVIFPLVTSSKNSYTDFQLNLANNTLNNEPPSQLTQDLFINGQNALKNNEENSLIDFFKGHAYPVDKYESFLLQNFNEKQQKNFLEMLQLRDQFFVLNKSMKDLIAIANLDQTRNLQDALFALRPYINKIHLMQLKLAGVVEQFNQDCKCVYDLRRKQKYSKDREVWEKVYCNFGPQMANREQLNDKIEDLPQLTDKLVLNSVFHTLKARETNLNNFTELYKQLFPKETLQDSSFRENLETAKKQEIKRQYYLLKMREESLLNEYQFLLEHMSAEDKASEMGKNIEGKIANFQGRINQIKALEDSQDNPGAPMVSDLTESSFFLVEEDDQQSYVDTGEQNYKLLGMFQNYFQAKNDKDSKENQLALEQKIKELSAQISSLEAANKNYETTVTALQQENIRLKEQIAANIAKENAQKDEKINKKFNKQIQGLPCRHDLQTRLKEKGTQIKEQVGALATANLLINNMDEIIKHYTENSHHDKSLFLGLTIFEHNANGETNAHSIKRKFKALLQKKVDEIIFRGINKQDAETIKQELLKEATTILRKLLVDEKKSRFKQYSFRHYLLRFYQHLTNCDGNASALSAIPTDVQKAVAGHNQPYQDEFYHLQQEQDFCKGFASPRCMSINHKMPKDILENDDEHLRLTKANRKILKYFIKDNPSSVERLRQVLGLADKYTRLVVAAKEAYTTKSNHSGRTPNGIKNAEKLSAYFIEEINFHLNLHLQDLKGIKEATVAAPAPETTTVSQNSTVQAPSVFDIEEVPDQNNISSASNLLPEPLQDTVLNNLEKLIQKHAEKTLSDMVVKEKFSGFNRYSFRNYLAKIKNLIENNMELTLKELKCIVESRVQRETPIQKKDLPRHSKRNICNGIDSYELFLISDASFSQQGGSLLKKPYLIKDNNNHFSIWGYKENKWQRTELPDLQINFKWRENVPLTISFKDSILNTLKKGHTQFSSNLVTEVYKNLGAGHALYREHLCLTEENIEIIDNFLTHNSTNADNIKKLKDFIDLTHKCTKIMNDTVKAYKEAAKTKERGFLGLDMFSHNDNGVNNAEKLAKKFIEEITWQVNLNLDVLQEDSCSLDERIERLKDGILKFAHKTIDGMLKKEKFSGYKKYSFRNYLTQLAKLMEDTEVFKERDSDALMSGINEKLEASSHNFSM